MGIDPPLGHASANQFQGVHCWLTGERMGIESAAGPQLLTFLLALLVRELVKFTSQSWQDRGVNIFLSSGCMKLLSNMQICGGCGHRKLIFMLLLLLKFEFPGGGENIHTYIPYSLDSKSFCVTSTSSSLPATYLAREPKSKQLKAKPLREGQGRIQQTNRQPGWCSC